MCSTTTTTENWCIWINKIGSENSAKKKKPMKNENTLQKDRHETCERSFVYFDVYECYNCSCCCCVETTMVREFLWVNCECIIAYRLCEVRQSMSLFTNIRLRWNWYIWKESKKRTKKKYPTTITRLTHQQYSHCERERCLLAITLITKLHWQRRKIMSRKKYTVEIGNARFYHKKSQTELRALFR